MQLRPFQSRAVAAVRTALTRNPLLVSPTGSGKTVMGSAIAGGMRALWLAERRELIEQAACQLRADGAHVGIIKAGVDPSPDAPIQVASVATLVRRDVQCADVIFIDEAHRAVADQYRGILAEHPNTPRVGLTATPFRLDGRGLGDLFGEIIVAATTRQLCDAGYLHAPRVYASRLPDLRGVKVTAGDYSVPALAERVNVPEKNADIVKTWLARANGARTVAFGVDVQHSKAIAAAFVEAGIAAEHIDGTSVDRDGILARLANGTTRVVTNCMILTEGWDLPALEVAVIARPTASLGLHLQMIGRIMRACPGKSGAIVLDHAGNTHVHGLVTRALAYSLDGTKKVGAADALDLRRCGDCGLYFDTPACPECGWVPDPAERDRPVHGDGILGEYTDDFAYRLEYWHALEAQRQAASYGEAWSVFRFAERFGAKPAIDGDGELIDVKHARLDQKRAVYARLLAVARERGRKDGWASHQYKAIFGVWPSGFVNSVRGNPAAARVARLLSGG